MQKTVKSRKSYLRPEKLVVIVSAQVNQEPHLLQKNTVHTQTCSLNLTDTPALRHSIGKNYTPYDRRCQSYQSDKTARQTK